MEGGQNWIWYIELNFQRCYNGKGKNTQRRKTCGRINTNDAAVYRDKKTVSDCILFYRLGDFYEMFFEDALTASRELEITLTGKNCGQEEKAPMCGVPYHAVEGYLNKLVSKGYKVAICEQVKIQNRRKES